MVSNISKVRWQQVFVLWERLPSAFWELIAASFTMWKAYRKRIAVTEKCGQDSMHCSYRMTGMTAKSIRVHTAYTNFTDIYIYIKGKQNYSCDIFNMSFHQELRIKNNQVNNTWTNTFKFHSLLIRTTQLCTNYPAHLHLLYIICIFNAAGLLNPAKDVVWISLCQHKHSAVDRQRVDDEIVHI